MCKIAVVLGLSVTTALSAAACGQAGPTTLASPADAVPMYRVSLERREAVPGISPSSAIQLPFECTADGTIFVSFIGTVPASAGVQAPLVPPLQLVSVSPWGMARCSGSMKFLNFTFREKSFTTHPTPM